MCMRSLLRRTLLFAIVVLADNCAGRGVTTPGGAPAALTALPRDLSASEQSVLSATNAFSFALWHRISATQGDANVVVSPLSTSFALSMALNGAANQTFDEMRAGLRFGATSLPDIDAGYKSLIGLITSLDPAVTMDIANSIWYRSGFPFNQSFLDAGSHYFNAMIKPLDFTGTAAALAAINGWVASQTNGRIPTILDRIDDSNVMFLINAIYFKGSWRSRFDPAQTIDAPFHSTAGDQPVRLMHRHGTMSYVQTAVYQAVDLAYGDSAFTMTVVLPKPGVSVDTLAGLLDGQTWQSLTSGLHRGDVDLYLPRLQLSWERSLIPDLQALGMLRPFTDSADFTNMSPRGRELLLSHVKQKTFVEINEEGTEAAAVSVTGVSVTAAPVTSMIRVDRPFMLVIRERLSGTVIFMGKIVRIP